MVAETGKSGLGGVPLAGWALDHWFKGNWAAVCACMAVGVIGGYGAVMNFGGSPISLAVSMLMKGMAPVPPIT